MYNAKGKIKQKDLIQENIDLVKREALYMKTRLPDSVELDDLVQSGMLGLLDAVKKYNPVQGVAFESYARIRIKGSMIDELRKADWVPRRVREKTKDLDQAIHELRNKLGRHPEEREIAKQMNISISDLHTILSNTNSAFMVSLDDIGLTEVEKNSAEYSENPFEYLLEMDKEGELADAIRGLPERDQQVLALYYTEDVNMREIGEILGITESRVCQIHSRAIARLRANFIKED